MTAAAPALSATVLACTDETPPLGYAPSDNAWAHIIERSDYLSRPDWDLGYEALRDTVIAAFNPPDDDGSEASIMTEALDRVYAYVVAQPCTCRPDVIDERDPCPRCDVLGRALDRPVSR